MHRKKQTRVNKVKARPTERIDQITDNHQKKMSLFEYVACKGQDVAYKEDDHDDEQHHSQVVVLLLLVAQCRASDVGPPAVPSRHRTSINVSNGCAYFM